MKKFCEWGSRRDSDKDMKEGHKRHFLGVGLFLKHRFVHRSFIEFFDQMPISARLCAKGKMKAKALHFSS